MEDSPDTLQLDEESDLLDEDYDAAAAAETRPSWYEMVASEEPWDTVATELQQEVTTVSHSLTPADTHGVSAAARSTLLSTLAPGISAEATSAASVNGGNAEATARLQVRGDFPAGAMAPPDIAAPCHGNVRRGDQPRRGAAPRVDPRPQITCALCPRRAAAAAATRGQGGEQRAAPQRQQDARPQATHPTTMQ